MLSNRFNNGELKKQNCVSNIHVLFQLGAQQLAGCKQNFRNAKTFEKVRRMGRIGVCTLTKKSKTSHEIF
jgi:hypothetical protein